MSSRSRLFFCYVLLSLVICGMLLVGTVAAGIDSGTVVAETHDFEADEVQIDISVTSDGSAQWTIEYWVALSDEEREAAFDDLRADIDEDPESVTAVFAERIDETVAGASDTTDREMSADEYHVSTDRQSLTREYGVVRYAFTWHGFAETVNDELVIGDAIEGIYLDEGTRLSIQWSDEYERVSVTPEPDDERDTAVIWYGSETDFVTGEPRVVLAPVSLLPSYAIIAGSLAALTLVLAGLGLYVRRRATPGAESIDPQAQSADHASPPPDSSLLSNEEQVLNLLRQHDNRMKQQRIVAELGWTDAKTSKVVSNLREAGQIESFRIGRENVLRVVNHNAPDSGENE